MTFIEGKEFVFFRLRSFCKYKYFVKKKCKMNKYEEVINYNILVFEEVLVVEIVNCVCFVI